MFSYRATYKIIHLKYFIIFSYNQKNILINGFYIQRKIPIIYKVTKQNVNF